MSLLQKVKRFRAQIIVLLLVLTVQCCFAFQKEGYHMDEMLSFQLANAEYNPWIVPTQPVGRLAKFMHEEIDGENLAQTLGNIKDTIVDVLQNRSSSKLLSYRADVYEEPVWISGEQFQEYITTGEGDRFNYLSVYFNVKDDNHPPVHFMLLHTVSSLFPGCIQPMMGCVINILAVLGCGILFMKLGMLLDKEDVTKEGMGLFAGTAAALLYGCSHAGIATMLLIRMYGVLIFFCLALFYLHVRKWLEGSFDRKNLWLILVTMLGFLTQYFFLFYCLILAAAAAVCLFVYKRRKELLVYIRSMVIAAVIGVGIYPFAVSDVFSSSRGVEALEKLDSGLSAFWGSMVAFGEILLERCFGNVWLGLMLVLLCLGMGVWLFCKKRAYRPLTVFFYVPAAGYFLLAAKLSPMYVDRYQMAAFPFVIAWFVVLVCMLAKRLEEKVLQRRDSVGASEEKLQCRDSAGRNCRLFFGKGKFGRLLASVVLLVFCGFHVLTYDGSYLYKGYEVQLEIAGEYSDLPCIGLYEGYWFYDNTAEFAVYDRTLLVTPEELLGRKDASDIEALEEVIFLVESLVDEDTFMEILDQYGFRIEEVLLEDGACGDSIYLCVRMN